VDSNSEIQGYNFYPMLHFRRKFSSSVILLSLSMVRRDAQGLTIVQGKVPRVGLEC